MEYQNVTISLPERLIREAKHLAVDRGVSLSKFVATLVEERVDAVKRYQQARERQRRLLEHGLPLGTRGRIDWRREDVHER